MSKKRNSLEKMVPSKETALVNALVDKVLALSTKYTRSSWRVGNEAQIKLNKLERQRLNMTIQAIVLKFSA